MALGIPRRIGTPESQPETPGGEHERHFSGVRPATPRDASEEDGELASALASVSHGRLAEGTPDSAEGEALRGLAAALPELLGGTSMAQTIALGHSNTELQGGLRDLVLVSARHVHVAQRTTDDPNVALVCVARRNASIGLIVSEARARLTRG